MLTFLKNFIYLFIFLFFSGCVGCSSLRECPLQLRQAGATPHRGARAPHRRGPPLLQSTGSRRAGSVVVAHRPSRSAACGIPPDQGSNPCPPHRHADSQPLRHQGSPEPAFWSVSMKQVKLVSYTDLWTLGWQLQRPDLVLSSVRIRVG